MALGNQISEQRLSEGSDPQLLEANFPSLQEQSRHWSLNEEQHHAFLLMGAALLQHIYITNQLSEFEHNQRLVNKIRVINNYLDTVMPVNRHLVMFLAGSGGTENLASSNASKISPDAGILWHPPSSALPLASQPCL
jgi:hypothetical protein